LHLTITGAAQREKIMKRRKYKKINVTRRNEEVQKGRNKN
jgi:hypothetical protein